MDIPVKSNTITFNPDGWKVKITERTKGRMKFQLKLSQEESDAFKNFSNSVKPDNVSMDNFIKSIFFTGVRALEAQLTENLMAHMEANREEFEEKGFAFDENGKCTGMKDNPDTSVEGSVEIVE